MKNIMPRRTKTLTHSPFADNCYSHKSEGRTDGAALVIRFEEIVKYSMINVRRMCYLLAFLLAVAPHDMANPIYPHSSEFHRHLNATQRHSRVLEPLSLSFGGHDGEH